jgi:hypothetical protein
MGFASNRPVDEGKALEAVSDAPVMPVPAMVAVAVMVIGVEKFKVPHVPVLVAVTVAGENETVTDPVTVALPLQQLQFTGKEKPFPLFVAVATFVGEQINPGLRVLSVESKLSYVS